MADRSARRAGPEQVGVPRQTRSRSARLRAERARRRRRSARALSVLVLVAVTAGVAVLGYRLWDGLTGGAVAEDFAGGGERDVVVEVRQGDTTTAIGQMLTEQDVVATTAAFVGAADGNSAISAIQPGFYKVRTRIPAADAVARLADPAGRVGRLVIPEGRQLDDVADVGTGAVTQGILTLISSASCVDLDGAPRCVGVDALRDAARDADLAALAVPPWAAGPATALGPDHRRIEGLIAPGTWNVDPDAPPAAILAALIGPSAQRYAADGLIAAGDVTGLTPYQMLVVASLIQRESTPQDFAKVARVVTNRMAANRTLEFDSTVNFALDRTEVATTDADRGRPTPWNTYLNPGLPATPICSPGQPALLAAERPEPGDWLYFVTIDKQGTTLFTVDYAQHLANIELALRNGVLDSAR